MIARRGFLVHNIRTVAEQVAGLAGGGDVFLDDQATRAVFTRIAPFFIIAMRSLLMKPRFVSIQVHVQADDVDFFSTSSGEDWHCTSYFWRKFLVHVAVERDGLHVNATARLTTSLPMRPMPITPMSCRRVRCR